MDPYFPPDEELYRRINPKDVDDSGRLLEPDAAFIFPDDGTGISFNRQRYSGSPADCLGVRTTWRIGAFLVRHIPDAIAAADGRVIRFRAEHHPIEQPPPPNPGHSEVRAYHLGQFTAKPPKDVRLLFRLHIGQRLGILP